MVKRVLETLRESPTRRMDAVREELKRKGVDVIMLSTGQPSLPPPRWLRERLAEKLLEESMDLYRYTPSAGIMELREAIAEDIKALGGPRLEPDQIVVTAGGQSAMWSTIASIVEPDTEILLLDPTFFGYPPLIEYHGGRVKWVPVDVENDYQPDPERVKEAIVRGRTRAIVLVTPDNPTGRILDEETAKAIAEYAADMGVWIIVDEAYKTLIYEGSHVWVYRYAPDSTIAVNTFSKDPGMAGWRLGYVYGPPETVKAIHKVVEHTVYCPSSIAQTAALIYLRERRLRMEHIESVKRVYRARRDAALKYASEMLPDAVYSKPRGAMFLLLHLDSYLKGLGMDSEKLAQLLLERKAVSTVPGTYFGETTRYALRISFVSETEERLREGTERLAALLKELGAG